MRGHPGQLLEALALLPHQLPELFLAIRNDLLAATEVAGPATDVLIPLIEDVEFAVERVLAFAEPLLLLLDFRTPSADLLLEGLPELDQLLLSRDDGTLAEVLSLAFRV